MNNKLLIVGVIATTALLGGCSNKTAQLQDSVDVLTNQVGELTTKVDGLAADQAAMKADTEAAAAAAQAAASEAARANARIDNIAESYKK